GRSRRGRPAARGAARRGGGARAHRRFGGRVLRAAGGDRAARHGADGGRRRGACARCGDVGPAGRPGRGVRGARGVAGVVRADARSEPWSGRPAPLWLERLRWTSRTSDRALAVLFLPAVAAVARAGAWVRTRWAPQIGTSLLYILVTALVLIALLFLPQPR